MASSHSALLLLGLLGCSLFSAHAQMNGMGTLGTTDGGSCGFTEGWPAAGVLVTGFSQAIYNEGAVCGGCWSVKCTGSAQCKAGTEVLVTVTNQCMSTNATNPCTPPNSAVNLQPEAFDIIAKTRAPGIVGATWTPVPCVRTGGVQFLVTTGNQYYMAVLIQNVAGPGALSAVYIKAGAGAFVAMTRSFGSVWQVNDLDVMGKAISFMLVGYNGQRLVIPNALPNTWAPEKMFNTAINFAPPKATAALGKKAPIKK